LGYVEDVTEVRTKPGTVFHQSLENASADFDGERAFVAGTVVGGEGEEVGGISLEAGHGIAG
jgi:hypothetical protein